MELMQRSAPLYAGNGQWNSYHAPPHCVGVVGSGTHAMPCLTAKRVVGSATPAYALPHCLGAVGSGTPAMHSLTACGQWAVEFLLCTATLSRRSGLWNFCNALPHCLGAFGSATLAIHYLIASGQWAVQLLHLHCHTTQARWAMQLLQRAGPYAGGAGNRAQQAVTA